MRSRTIGASRKSEIYAWVSSAILEIAPRKDRAKGDSVPVNIAEAVEQPRDGRDLPECDGTVKRRHTNTLPPDIRGRLDKRRPSYCMRKFSEAR